MGHPPKKRGAHAHTDSRAKILRAASRLFMRKGFEATTMQDIVRAARTSIGNVYFYFENKEALASTLLEEAATETWKWTDDAAAHVPLGPARLAVMVLANTATLLGENEDLTRILLLGATTKSLRDKVAARFGARIRSNILANLPDYPTERIDLATTAWIGAARNCLEQLLSGQLQGDAREIGEFVVRWNLRGLGVPDATIDEAIAVAATVVAEMDRANGGKRSASRRNRYQSTLSPA